MARRRVTYRPSKASGVIGVVFGSIFVLIGLFVAIPTAGPFGILWTLAAAAITAGNAYAAFGKKFCLDHRNLQGVRIRTGASLPRS